jgi:hypothetical protein
MKRPRSTSQVSVTQALPEDLMSLLPAVLNKSFLLLDQLDNLACSGHGLGATVLGCCY